MNQPFPDADMRIKLAALLAMADPALHGLLGTGTARGCEPAPSQRTASRCLSDVYAQFGHELRLEVKGQLVESPILVLARRMCNRFTLVSGTANDYLIDDQYVGNAFALLAATHPWRLIESPQEISNCVDRSCRALKLGRLCQLSNCVSGTGVMCASRTHD